MEVRVGIKVKIKVKMRIRARVRVKAEVKIKTWEPVEENLYNKILLLLNRSIKVLLRALIKVTT